jgi:plastocyanin
MRNMTMNRSSVWGFVPYFCVFRNRDDIPHSVVGSKGEFHSKALDTDDSYSFTFAKAGTYGYSCGLHPRMQGRIVVIP